MAVLSDGKDIDDRAAAVAQSIPAATARKQTQIQITYQTNKRK
jgi:hypothetical protein